MSTYLSSDFGTALLQSGSILIFSIVRRSDSSIAHNPDLNLVGNDNGGGATFYASQMRRGEYKMNDCEGRGLQASAKLRSRTNTITAISRFRSCLTKQPSEVSNVRALSTRKLVTNYTHRTHPNEQIHKIFLKNVNNILFLFRFYQQI